MWWLLVLFSGEEIPAKNWQACTDNEFMSSHLYVSVSSELWLCSPRYMKLMYTVLNVVVLLLQLGSLLVTSFSICTDISKDRDCFTRQYEPTVPLSCLVVSSVSHTWCLVTFIILHTCPSDYTVFSQNPWRLTKMGQPPFKKFNVNILLNFAFWNKFKWKYCKKSTKNFYVFPIYLL